jgi:hypothetical protein
VYSYYILALGDLAETSVVLELYLQVCKYANLQICKYIDEKILQAVKSTSPAVACKEMLLFLKFYDPFSQTLR